MDIHTTETTTASTTQTAAGPEAAPAQERRAFMGLIRRLINESLTLARQEIDLAKAEMAEKARVYARNSAILSAGGAVAYAGFLCLLAAAIAGLTVALGNAMAWYHALWLSALIVGVVVAGVGYAMLQKAITTMKRTGVSPDQTVETLRENRQWLKDKMNR